LRKKYGENLVLVVVLKMSPTPGAATTPTSSSTFTASSAGVAYMARNHGSSGGMPSLPIATRVVGETSVGVGSE
jgi:hypothetical protein